MSLRSTVAGPSRLPYISHGIRAVRGYATGADAVDDSGTSKSRDRPERVEPFSASYEDWKKGYGEQFRRPLPGKKARWLGGSVPFPNNPSFKPPPPLSNALQQMIWADLRAGKRTVGQISELYGVSKARIEGIRKLKEIEVEYKRQGFTLQKAYQREMETLLGVQSPLNKQGQVSPVALRQQEDERRSSEPTRAEMDEEAQRDANTSVGGAFGDLRLEARLSGLEKDAWEFMDEKSYLADKDLHDVTEAAPKVEAKVPKVVKKAEPKTTVAQAGKTVFRFVDTSSK